MKKFILALFVLSQSVFATQTIVAKYDLKPPRAYSLPNYIGYHATVEKMQGMNGYYDFLIHFQSYFQCNTQPCPVVRLPGPSTLRVYEMYYGQCNAFIVNSRSIFSDSLVTAAVLSDNRTWRCNYPPIAPVGARIRYADGSEQSFVGHRLYK